MAEGKTWEVDNTFIPQYLPNDLKWFDRDGLELKVMMILPLKNIFYSAITHLILKISQFLQATTMTLKSR